MTESEPSNCSAQMIQIVLEGAREVLDSAELAVLFETAGVQLPGAGQSFNGGAGDVRLLAAALDMRYGVLGARGALRRVRRPRRCCKGWPGIVSGGRARLRERGRL